MGAGWGAVVLAGGRARRLGGGDKAALVVGGRTLPEPVLLACLGAGAGAGARAGGGARARAGGEVGVRAPPAPLVRPRPGRAAVTPGAP